MAEHFVWHYHKLIIVIILLKGFINAGKESRRDKIAFLFLLPIILNSFSNLSYFGTTGTQISLSKPNVKLFHLLGSSSLQVNLPLVFKLTSGQGFREVILQLNH